MHWDCALYDYVESDQEGCTEIPDEVAVVIDSNTSVIRLHKDRLMGFC